MTKRYWSQTSEFLEVETDEAQVVLGHGGVLWLNTEAGCIVRVKVKNDIRLDDQRTPEQKARDQQ